MKRKIGSALIFLGMALILCAAGLLIRNERQDADAGRAAQQVLPELMQQIEERHEQRAESPDPVLDILPGTPPELIDPALFQMTEVEIDGYGYVGYLSIPALELELPVMGQWDYDRLKIAPCRYNGSVLGEDLVIMAHNYNRHFGRLKDLVEGDRVVFMDMDGRVTYYQVAALDVLMPQAVDEMTAGLYDLTLFTCTYGGQSRVTVYCNQEE